jgi:hypothetical protein
MFTGNRGIIHDPRTRTLLNSRWTSRAWLICRLQWRGIRRTVMGTGSWTELCSSWTKRPPWLPVIDLASCATTPQLWHFRPSFLPVIMR